MSDKDDEARQRYMTFEDLLRAKDALGNVPIPKFEPRADFLPWSKTPPPLTDEEKARRVEAFAERGESRVNNIRFIPSTTASGVPLSYWLQSAVVDSTDGDGSDQ